MSRAHGWGKIPILWGQAPYFEHWAFNPPIQMQGCWLPIVEGIGSGCSIVHSPILFLMVFTTICPQFVLHVFLNFILYGLGNCCSPNSYLLFTCVPSIILYALPNIPYVVLICSPCCSQLASHFIPFSLPKLLLFLADIHWPNWMKWKFVA
jgi:hypothetical protein